MQLGFKYLLQKSKKDVKYEKKNILKYERNMSNILQMDGHLKEIL